MKLVKKILNKLNGLHYPQEYLCLAQESFQQPLHIYLADTRSIIKDITNQHVFAGYHPLIFALPAFTGINLDGMAEINVVFSETPLQENAFFSAKDSIALLILRFIRKQDAGSNSIYYYEGIRGQHRFLSSSHQFIIGLNNKLFNRRSGNVFLQNNLYKQVQIAYAKPRIISLVTVSQKNLVNLFPSDLHGQVDEQHYIVSLRHGGKACSQVEEAGRILISEVHCDAYRTVYALGKNHMQDFKEKENFPLSDSVSGIFQLPVPESALYYRELELKESFIHGIHKILLFKIRSQQVIRDIPATLAHIHNCYATWRFNRGLEGNYLLR
jgi:hypothetical protein